MSRSRRLGEVLEAERTNAAIAWLLVAFVGLVVFESLLDGDLLWAGFAVIVVALALVPIVAHRRPTEMLPWEVLALAALPLIGRALAANPLFGRFATYLSVAAIALIIAVELHTFTPVRMTPGFAVLFVVIATMATSGLWAVARWLLDITLGTGFLLVPGVPEAEIETALMWEFVYSTAAGVVAGVVFEVYFRRLARLDGRRSMGDPA